MDLLASFYGNLISFVQELMYSPKFYGCVDILLVECLMLQDFIACCYQ